MMQTLRDRGFVVLYLGACEFVEYLFWRSRGGDNFPPKLGLRLIRSICFAVCVFGIIMGVRMKSWSGPIYVVLLWMSIRWLRTIVADSDELSSFGPFGIFRRTISWPDVSRVSSDWQEKRLTWGLDLIWQFTGYSVTVVGRDGSEIQYSVFNSGQGKFLDTLRRFVPREAFDAGLHDWHP